MQEKDQARGMKRSLEETAGSHESATAASTKKKHKKSSRADSQAQPQHHANTSSGDDSTKEAHPHQQDDIPGAKWHHHHRYNTRLQEEIEGPDSDLLLEQQKQQNAPALITPPRAGPPDESSPSKASLLDHDPEPNALGRKAFDHQQQPLEIPDSVVGSATFYERSIKVKDLFVIMLVAAVMLSLTVGLYADTILSSVWVSSLLMRHHEVHDNFAHRRHTGALQAKIELCHAVATEFHKGPPGDEDLVKKQTQSLFHPPLDSILAESSQQQVAWLRHVQKARQDVSTASQDNQEKSVFPDDLLGFLADYDWDRLQEQVLDFVALWGQQIQG